MSRTTKDTAQYFPHEADASGGDTLTALEGQFGNDGYTFWFKLLEKLCRSPGHYLDTNDTKPWIVHLGRCRVDENRGVEMVNLLVEMGALDKELWLNQRIIWSQNLVNNLADVYRNRRRPIPDKPQVSPYNLLEKGSENESDVIQKNLALPKLITTDEEEITTPANPLTTQQSIVKESKVKQNKEEKSKIVVLFSPSLEEIETLYVQNISLNPITSHMRDNLKVACREYSAPWVQDAIREAVLANQLTWRYVQGILNNWAQSGQRKT